VSFSLYSPVEVNLFVNDDQYLDFIHIEHEFKKGWNHISIFVRNSSVFYLLNKQVIKSVDAFNPYEITVKTKNDTFWKIHDCEYPNINTMIDDYVMQR
jgi:hypothetical protein